MNRFVFLYGAKVEVLEPMQLRNTITEIANTLNEKYHLAQKDCAKK